MTERAVKYERVTESSREFWKNENELVKLRKLDIANSRGS